MRTLTTLLLLATISSCTQEPFATADNDFDVSVAAPTYTVGGPKVLFDEGHNNIHTTTGTYQPFANLVRNDGYAVTATDKAITHEVLDGFDIYVVANARGGGDVNDGPAFTEQECGAISEWVRNGGSLLLITDHFPMGSAVERLAGTFGVEMQKGLVQDSLHYDPTSNDESQLEFSRKNGLLVDHPITTGVDRVITFTGQSIRCDSCLSFLNLSPSAYDLSARTEITRDGDDTRVDVTFHDAVSAQGRSQGVALQFGKGRVVVLGEAAMLSAQHATRDGSYFGMNVNAGNKQLALNIVHWLAQEKGS